MALNDANTHDTNTNSDTGADAHQDQAATAPTASGVSRRQLLVTAGAGAGAAALLMEPGPLHAQTGRPIVFSHITIINPDLMQNDMGLAVVGNRIAAIGPTDTILAQYPGADVYDGRGKALLPGLVNCHAHMTAAIARGFNEDFGFPNSANLPVSPNRMLSAEERELMVTISALEAIKTGTTTIVQNESNIAPYAAALAGSGLRCVFAESFSDQENAHGPMSDPLFAKSTAPVFSAKLLDQGMQSINDLFSKWHGAENGRISVFPAAALCETSSPDLLRAVRAFAEKHDLGYTIHLSQTHAEINYMLKYHGLRPPAYLDKADFLGPRLFAAHCRYMDDNDIALVGKTRTIISHQANMAANRAVIPPIALMRAAGSPIANGTDNNTNDVAAVMKIALLTERISRHDAIPGTVPQPEDMLADNTLGGAKAVNQEKTQGLLKVGMKADILVLDTQRAHLVPCGRILSAWIHNGQASDIESNMVDGRFIMRNYKVRTMDEEAVIAAANRVGHRIWDKILENGPLKLPGRPI